MSKEYYDNLNWLSTSKSCFLQKNVEFKRNFLGNLMFERVISSGVDQNIAPRITGMLIDFEVMTVNDIQTILLDDRIYYQYLGEALFKLIDMNYIQ